MNHHDLFNSTHDEGPPITNEDSLIIRLEEDEEAAAAAAASLLEQNIAEATALAIEAAAVGEVDVTAAANAAAIEAANLVDAAGVPMSVPDDDDVDDMMHEDEAEIDEDGNITKEGRGHKRYRDKTMEDMEGDFGIVGGVADDSLSLGSAPKRNSSVGESANGSHEDQLAARRLKDRQRYATMTPDQRHSYNMKRREQYHRQSEISRQRRRERERNRYHALLQDDAKHRNNRRAKLERERYQKMTSEDLEAKNRKRRERAALARQKKDAEKALTQDCGTSLTDTALDAACADVAAQAAEVVAAVKADVMAMANVASEEQLQVAAAAAEAAASIVESIDV